MTYLDRLKKLDSGKRLPSELPKLPKPPFSEKRLPSELPKLPKPPFDSKDSSHVTRFQKTASANDPIVGADTTAAVFDQEWFEERAAIYEFDAGFTRQEAERLAYLEVSKWLH